MSTSFGFAARRKGSYFGLIQAVWLALLLLASAPSMARVPGYFYAISNWYVGGGTSHEDQSRILLAHQYPDAYSSAAVEWAQHIEKCANGTLIRLLDGVQMSKGYDPGDVYDIKVTYIDVYDCQKYYQGNYDSSSVLYSNCNGDVREHNWYHVNNCPPPTLDHEKNRGQPKCPCAGIGDPIHPGTGSKYDRLVLYQGSGSFPLDLEVSYDGISGASIAVNRLTQVLGLQRTHSYMRAVHMSSFGTAATAYVLREDGKTYAFDRNGTAWVGDADIQDRLEATYAADGSVTGWTYRTESMDTETYDSSGRLLSIARLGLTQTLTYDAAGHLMRVTDPEGRFIDFNYRADGLLDHVDTPNGTVAFTYDANPSLSRITWPDLTHRDYLYAEAGHGGPWYAHGLTGVIDEAGQRIDSTSYDDQGRAIVDQGPAITGSTSLAYSATADGNPLLTVTHPLGSTETMDFVYRAGVPLPSKIVKSCDGCTAQVTTYGYDDAGRMTTRQEPNGSTTNFVNDSNGLVLSTSRAAGTPDEVKTTTVWDTALRKPLTTTVADAKGNVLEKRGWAYNATGQTTAECLIDSVAAPSYTCTPTGTTPAGVRRSVTTYCTSADAQPCPLVGLVASVDGPRTDVSDVTRYAYYKDTDETGCGSPGGACHHMGDIYSITNAAGQVVYHLGYDRAGRIVREKDVNGVITDLAYNPRGWLTRRTIRANADGTPSDADATTTMAYDPTGTLHSVTDPDNVTVTYTYDDAHRLSDIIDGKGNRIHYTLDAAGNRTREETFDAGHTLRRSIARTYNNLSQLITTKDGLGQTIFDASANGSYDANGNLVQSRGALGAIHQDVVDALNRVVTSIDNANGADLATKDTTNQYVFDALDRLTSVTDPDGLSTHYGFDGLGNPSSLQSPDTGSSSATFDAAGNTLTKTDAKGITVTNTYDALNRLVSASYVDTRANAAYHFDEANSVTGCATSYPQGRLTRVVEPAVTTTFCYDFQGQVTEKRQTQGTVTDTVSYVHTRAGRLAAIGTPSGAVTEYGRDALGQITSVTVTPAQGAATPVVTTASYLPFGPIASYTLGNGQTITRTYDANYRATDVVSPALNLHFARNAAGNVMALGDGADANPASETYQYDPLHRLTSVNDSSNGAIESYSYSKTGDRLSKTASGLATGAYQYRVNTHWLTTLGTASRLYDANGSMTANASAGVASGYGYDARGNMAIAQRGGENIGTYTYNEINQRISKQANSADLRFTYNEESQLLGEYGTSSRDYIWMDSIPLATFDGSKASFVHSDDLNTPRAITDSQGMPLWQWRSIHDPFGEMKPSSGEGYTYNLRFPGQYSDDETGLLYNVNRYYDPSTGRYVQSDPIGLNGGNSTFSYAQQNPLSYTDPLGLLIWNNQKTIIRRDFSPKDSIISYPGMPPQTPQPSTGGVTTVDWQIEPQCTCSDGGYKFDQYSVSVGFTIAVRSSFDGYSISQRQAILDEQDHVRDGQTWTNAAKRLAITFENAYKGEIYSSLEECKRRTKTALEAAYQDTYLHSARNSINRYDYTGGPHDHR